MAHIKSKVSLSINNTISCGHTLELQMGTFWNLLEAQLEQQREASFFGMVWYLAVSRHVELDVKDYRSRALQGFTSTQAARNNSRLEGT